MELSYPELINGVSSKETLSGSVHNTGTFPRFSTPQQAGILEASAPNPHAKEPKTKPSLRRPLTSLALLRARRHKAPALSAQLAGLLKAPWKAGAFVITQPSAQRGHRLQRAAAIDPELSVLFRLPVTATKGRGCAGGERQRGGQWERLEGAGDAGVACCFLLQTIWFSAAPVSL